MDKIVIEVQKREVTGKKVNALRREGLLPAVIYGFGVEPTPIMMDHHENGRTLAQAEASTLIMIKLEGKEYPTLIREKQWNYIRRSLLHVDFQAVSMTEKIAAQVRVDLVGDAAAVADGGILVTGLTELSVEALPTDFPESIEVDLVALKEIGDGIFVRDIVVDDKLALLDDPDAMIVVASAPMAAAPEGEEDMGEMLEGEEETEDEGDEE